MSFRTLVIWLSVLLLTSAPGALGDVIAAPESLDQPLSGADASDAGSSLVSSTVLVDGLMGLAAVVVLALIIGRRWYRLAEAPQRPAPLSPPAGGALLLCMLVLAGVGASLSIRFLPEPVEPEGLAALVRPMVGAYVGQLFAAIPYLLLNVAATPPSPDRRWSRSRAVGLGAIALAMIWPLAMAAAAAAGLVQRLITGRAPDVVAHQTLQLMIGAPRDLFFAVTVFGVVVMAPLLEEVMYRGLVQQVLRQLGVRPWPAIVLTSAAFAAMHWSIASPHALVPLFVLSLGFGWAYERSGRLLAPFVMHALFNLGNLLLALPALPAS